MLRQRSFDECGGAGRSTLRSLLLAGVLLGLGVLTGHRLATTRSTSGVRTLGKLGPFTVTQQADDGTNLWVVFWEDGRFFWTIGRNTLSMNAGLEQSSTFVLNPNDDRVLRTTLELLSTNGPGVWISDFDADGVPDKRQIKGVRGWQVFYGGRFYDSTVSEGRRWIELNTRRVAVVFTNGVWVADQ